MECELTGLNPGIVPTIAAASIQGQNCPATPMLNSPTSKC